MNDIPGAIAGASAGTVPEVCTAARQAPMERRAVAREFRDLLCAGARLRCAGEAAAEPDALLRQGYLPRYRLDLFDVRFYVGRQRYDDDIGYCVAWVRLGSRPRELHARIFYKDLSLIWRCATHRVDSPAGRWIGKGEVHRELRGDEEILSSLEHTTDLPLELQPLLDCIAHEDGPALRDLKAVRLVLRGAPASRVEPYRDFSAPRRSARADPAARVNRGRPVARFLRRNDPASLRFAPGYEPDFEAGVCECARSASRFYGGEVRKLRILSRNRRIQYLFVEAPRHCWVIPPQSLSRDIGSYGVRLDEVKADDDLFVPGYEYHYLDDEADPPYLYSQIPDGYAGAPNPLDDTRADASPWLDALPVIQGFRRRLGR